MLVAPWIDPDRREGDFLQFDFNKEALNKIKHVHLFHSQDDMDMITKSVNHIMQIYPNITRHDYTDKGHFCFSDTGATFEDLWKVMK